MKMPTKIDCEMIAPCGVNCLFCSAYLNKKNPCPGCRALTEKQKRKSCLNCAKKKCAFDKGLTWCFECDRFPCPQIKALNKRYLINYDIDLIQNGFDAIKDIEAFLVAQQKNFSCSLCGNIIDQHHRKCSECGNN